MIKRILSMAYFKNRKEEFQFDEVDAAYMQNWKMINKQRKSTKPFQIVKTGKLGVLTLVKGVDERKWLKNAN